MGLWSPAVKNRIIYEDGSVQKIPEIPEDLKVIYKYVFTIWSCNMLLFLIFPMLIHFFFLLRTVWEIKQRILVDMAVDRGCYIDQSQSLNIHMDQPNFGKLTSLHFHAWSRVRAILSILIFIKLSGPFIFFICCLLEFVYIYFLNYYLLTSLIFHD